MIHSEGNRTSVFVLLMILLMFILMSLLPSLAYACVDNVASENQPFISYMYRVQRRDHDLPQSCGAEIFIIATFSSFSA